MDFGVTGAQAEKRDKEDGRRGVTETEGVEAEVEATPAGLSIPGRGTVAQRTELRR